MKLKKRTIKTRKKKGDAMLFRLIPAAENFLRSESERTGKTMVKILEETLGYRSQFKTWPPA